mgnify:FL=1
MKKLTFLAIFAIFSSLLMQMAAATFTRVTEEPESWDCEYLIYDEVSQYIWDGSKEGDRLLTIGNSSDANGAITADGKVLPYSFKALNDGELTINVSASKTDWAESDALEGTYTVVTPQVEPLSISSDFGKILIGTEITISCPTENAVLNGTIAGQTIENAKLPYSFIAESTGDLAISVHASKEYCTDSEVLEGTYNVCYPQIEPLRISPDFGLIEKGSVITTSYPEGTTLNGTINGDPIENAPNPYTFTAEKNGEIIVNVWASKDEMEDSEILSGTFTVETYAYKDVISYSDKEFINGVNANFFDITRNGAVYSLWGNIVEDDQEVNHHLKFDRKAGNKIGIVMKSSPASVSSIAITWDESSTSGAGFIIYGKNCPYKGVYQLHDAGEEIGTLITTVKYSESTNNATTVELGEQFSFIGIRPVDSEISNIKSIEFRWNENTQGGQDVSYKKATSTYISDGRFAVLSTIYGDAVKREETLGGHLNSTEVEISSSTISLAKGQTDVDEFEIIKNKDNTYYLRGGLEYNDTRRYLAGVQNYGLKLLPEPDETAKVTLEKKSDGIVVKFKDGDYLMYGDNKFVKGGYVDNATPTDEDVVLMPVYVYVSSSNNSTGVEEITINEDDSDTMYFNLNGVRINAENITPGIYIVRQGNKVSKKVIR